MEGSQLIVTLALVTMTAVVVFALVSKRRVLARKEDDSAPKSTLAADGSDRR